MLILKKIYYNNKILVNYWTDALDKVWLEEVDFASIENRDIFQGQQIKSGLKNREYKKIRNGEDYETVYL